MKVKEPPVRITIRPRTVVKVVVVSYLTFSFLSVLDRQAGKVLGPRIDRLSDKLREKTEEQKDAWREAVS